MLFEGGSQPPTYITIATRRAWVRADEDELWNLTLSLFTGLACIVSAIITAIILNTPNSRIYVANRSILGPEQ